MTFLKKLHNIIKLTGPRYNDLLYLPLYTKVYGPIIPTRLFVEAFGFYGFAKTNYTQEYGLIIHPPFYFKMCRFFRYNRVLFQPRLRTRAPLGIMTNYTQVY